MSGGPTYSPSNQGGLGQLVNGMTNAAGSVLNPILGAVAGAQRPGIPANRQLALNPRTTPMARPMPGRPMVDSQGHVIGGGQPPQNRFMPGPMGPGRQPGQQPGGPQIGFGMPPGLSVSPGFGGEQAGPGSINSPQPDGPPPLAFNPMPTQPDGAPPGAPPPGQISFGMPGGKSSSPGGKAGFGGPAITPFNAVMPAGAGQGSPFQSGAQFSQNT